MWGLELGLEVWIQGLIFVVFFGFREDTATSARLHVAL